MANQIGFGYRSGATLTYLVYTPAGAYREGSTPISVTETPSGSGYYTATDNNILALDYVIVKEGTYVVMQGQYEPTVTTTDSSTIISINSNVSQILANQHNVSNVFDQIPPTTPGTTKAFLV